MNRAKRRAALERRAEELWGWNWRRLAPSHDERTWPPDPYADGCWRGCVDRDRLSTAVTQRLDRCAAALAKAERTDPDPADAARLALVLGLAELERLAADPRRLQKLIEQRHTVADAALAAAIRTEERDRARRAAEEAAEAEQLAAEQEAERQRQEAERRAAEAEADARRRTDEANARRAEQELAEALAELAAEAEAGNLPAELREVLIGS